jgi:NAD(P)-dependent dehydrogenase (short-subunit alcohol dehydrogenase family)
LAGESRNRYAGTPFDLAGRTAVVIGGTGELCGAMAEGLASAGATAVLVGRSAEKAEARIRRIEEAGGSAEFRPCDVSGREGLEDLAEAVAAGHGKIDVLVNGAGVNSPTPFFDIREAELEKILEVNFKAVFRACQVFGRRMVEAGGPASVINVGSLSGLIPLSRVFTYSATKAAVHNLSKNLAREWATAGVRVNTLVPGFFPAEQNRKILSEERVGKILGHTPMNRFGEARELIGATLLLASEAGSFLTGAEIPVDGGYSAMTI